MRTIVPALDPSAHRPLPGVHRMDVPVPQDRQNREMEPQTAPNRPVDRQLDPRTRDALIVAHMSLVHSIARRIHARLPKSVTMDDLNHEGYIGLIEGIDRYDECRRVPLKLFVRQRITGAILDFLRSLDWVPRSVRRRHDTLGGTRDLLHRKFGRLPERDEMAAALKMTGAEYDHYVTNSEIRRVVSTDTPVGPESTTPIIETLSSDDDTGAGPCDQELRQALRAAVDRLPAKEREAVVGFYLEERPLVEVGAELGVSESRASQLHRMGVNRLRFKIREHLEG